MNKVFSTLALLVFAVLPVSAHAEDKPVAGPGELACPVTLFEPIMSYDECIGDAYAEVSSLNTSIEYGRDIMDAKARYWKLKSQTAKLSQMMTEAGDAGPEHIDAALEIQSAVETAFVLLDLWQREPNQKPAHMSDKVEVPSTRSALSL